MKKPIIFLLLLCLSMSVAGCNGRMQESESYGSYESGQSEEETSENLVEMKEVIFANAVHMGILKDIQDDSKVQLMLPKYVEDENALYACYVRVSAREKDRITVPRETGESDEEYKIRNRTYEIEYIVNLMKEKGFTVLEDYPYTYYNHENLYEETIAFACESEYLLVGECVIVGTYEQFTETFQDEELMKYYYVEALIAPRPDYVDLMKQYGYTEEEKNGVGAWVDYYCVEIMNRMGGEFDKIEIPLTVPNK